MNLAGAFLLLVLTQTALLSAMEETDQSAYNGLLGMLMGTLAAAIGIYMLLRRLPRNGAEAAGAPQAD